MTDVVVVVDASLEVVLVVGNGVLDVDRVEVVLGVVIVVVGLVDAVVLELIGGQICGCTKANG